MATFRVWAPEAKQVELEVRGRRRAMESRDRGWWVLEVPEAAAGDDYAFRVDGSGPRPDPRSRSQPAGPAGPSRLVDPSAFRWTDRGWSAPPLSSAVLYELHVGTFSPEGTFDGAIGRLDHLADLGVTHVELMPVVEFAGERGWGYDGVDLWAPHHAYGGPEGLARFADACHARHLAVVLDVVYNHLGPSGNYLEQFGPYFTHEIPNPWGATVNFGGPHSDEVRAFFLENALMWLRDYHLDGLRLDAVHAYYDPSAVHILEELRDAVEALEAHLGRHLVLIAESDLNDPQIVRPPEVGGYGMDAQWSDDFHHALHAVLTGEHAGYYAGYGSLTMLATALRQAFVYAGEYCPFRSRRHGRPPTGLPGWRFLGYLQNHDQVGNRLKGRRTSHLVSPARLRIGSAVVFASPFVPMLFQGEEWGASTPFRYFTDYHERELAQAVTEGRRSEFASFGWSPDEVPDPQDPTTFQRSKLDWGEVARPPHAELLDWHRRLIRLRRALPALTDGRMEQVLCASDEQAQWMTIRRCDLTVLINLHGQRQALPMEPHRPREVLLASGEVRFPQPDRVELSAESVAVLGPPTQF